MDKTARPQVELPERVVRYHADVASVEDDGLFVSHDDYAAQEAEREAASAATRC